MDQEVAAQLKPDQDVAAEKKKPGVFTSGSSAI
jgi:hypothetical protein